MRGDRKCPLADSATTPVSAMSTSSFATPSKPSLGAVLRDQGRLLGTARSDESRREDGRFSGDRNLEDPQDSMRNVGVFAACDWSGGKNLSSRTRRIISRKKPSLSFQDLERSNKRQKTSSYRVYTTPTRQSSSAEISLLLDEIFIQLDFVNHPTDGYEEKEVKVESYHELWRYLREISLLLRMSESREIFQTIPEERLTCFLRQLYHLTEKGRYLLPGVFQPQSVDGIGKILCSLEAIQIILRLLSSTEVPVQFQMDSIIETTMAFIQSCLEIILSFQTPAMTNEGKQSSGVEFLSTMEMVLMMLERFISTAAVETALLVPLVRLLMQILESNLQHYPVLSRNTVGVIVCISQRNPDTHPMILDELLTLIISQSTLARKELSTFQVHGVVQEDIQASTAVLLLMIQASVSLPEVDSTVSSSTVCCSSAFQLTEEFWKRLFIKLTSLNIDKTEGNIDTKQLVENLARDLLCVLTLPEYPAADLVLMGLVKILLSQGRELDQLSASLRLVSLDVLGMVALKLCQLSKQQQQDSVKGFSVAQCVLSVEGMKSGDLSRSEKLKIELLHYVGSLDAMNDLVWKHSHQYLSCNLWDEHVRRLNKEKILMPEEKLQEKLIHHIHQSNKTLNPNNIGRDVSLQAQSIMQNLVFESGIGQLKEVIIQTIASTASKQHKNAMQNANLRARAIKTLASLMETDSDLLAKDYVKLSIHNAFMDSPVCVRETALELIGQFIGNSELLTLQYYDLLVRSSQDQGLSVKKRAIKLLYESCIMPKSFPRRCEACLVLIQRFQDSEEQIQSFISKIFLQLWFAEETIEFSARDLCLILSSIRNLSTSYTLYLPVVSLLRSVLHQEKNRILEVGQKITDQLIQWLMETSCTQDHLALLMALHVFSAASIHFLFPENEPSKHLFQLYPFLASADETSQDQDQIHILLEISNALLFHLAHHLTEDHVTELKIKFYGFMTRNTQTKLIISSCKCLCTLANRLPSVGSFLCKIAAKYRQYIQQNLVEMTSHRLFFLLGHICLHCPDLLEKDNKAGLKIYMDLFLNLFSSAVDEKIKECALESICLLLKARSHFLRDCSQVDGLLKKAISQNEKPSLQKTALRSLSTLLKTEEEEGIPHNHGFFTNKHLETFYECHLSSGLIQSLWPEISSCAVLVNSEHDKGSNIRNFALELIRVILQGGLIAPWTVIPSLVALATDPHGVISKKALMILQSLKERKTDLFIKEVLTGIHLAHCFHSELQDQISDEIEDSVLQGLASVYTNFIQPSTDLTRRFLFSCLRPYKQSTNLASTEELVDFRFLWFCSQIVSSLPFNRVEECLVFISAADHLMSRTMETVLLNLKLQSEQPMSETNFRISNAAGALIILSHLRNHIKTMYAIRQEWIERFNTFGGHKQTEEKSQLTCRKPSRLRIQPLDFQPTQDPVRLQDQYFVLEGLFLDKACSDGDSEEEWKPCKASGEASIDSNTTMQLRNRK